MLAAIARLRTVTAAAPGVLVYPGMAEDLRRVLDAYEGRKERQERCIVTMEERAYLSNAAPRKGGQCDL